MTVDDCVDLVGAGDGLVHALRIDGDDLLGPGEQLVEPLELCPAEPRRGPGIHAPNSRERVVQPGRVRRHEVAVRMAGG